MGVLQGLSEAKRLVSVWEKDSICVFRRKTVSFTIFIVSSMTALSPNLGTRLGGSRFDFILKDYDFCQLEIEAKPNAAASFLKANDIGFIRLYEEVACEEVVMIESVPKSTSQKIE